ncbi:MAG: type II secretion system F family protein [Gammaproteobacteria bacterium]|nr:type II secretion system F family protein [Gammaproteobacteria bacterium]
MSRFSYTARNKRGEAVTGTIEADSPDRVAEQLFNSSLTPINIDEAEEKKAEYQALSKLFKPGVSLDELIMLCRQLYTLLKAGVPILRSLGSLEETARNATLKSTLGAIVGDIQSGRELNVALAQHPKIFSPLFISLIRVGESTGRMDEAFLQLAGYLELEKQTRDRIKTATRYPIIVIGAIVLAVVIINIWVIPAFADAFAKFDAELPWATQVLLASSYFFVNWWKGLLVGVIAAVIGFRYWIQTEQGDYIWSRFILKVPLFGSIIKKAVLGRFSRSLALSLRSGVPLVQALTVISGVVNNAFVGERVMGMRDGIQHGDSIARTAAATGLFTPLVLQMISIGEESGAVDDLLMETAEHYEREVSFELNRLADAIEPIIIVVIGVMVLILALGVFLPMWDLSTVANK